MTLAEARGPRNDDCGLALGPILLNISKPTICAEQEPVLALQAVHDEVPPDVLSPLLRQLVDQFVHDRARPEVMSLGLKTVRSLCERAPLVMTPDLLQVQTLGSQASASASASLTA